MRYFILLISCSLLCFGTDARPNVLIIYTDDQGALDMGCYGAKDLETPNMDSLAKRGVRFTHMYANSAVCSPSRAALLSGKNPLKAGLAGNAVPGSKGLPASNYLISEAFMDAGYRTAHIGKWHLGDSPDTQALAQGFEYTFGIRGGCIDNYSHYFYWAGPNIHDLYRNKVEVFAPGEYFPDMMVKEAKQFIKQDTTKPFFIYFAINMPHYPYQGEVKYLEKYKHIKDKKRQYYNAFVSSLDDKIGEVLDCLQSQGLTDNTIIILQSDNGHSTEERAMGGGGWCGNLRGAKQSLFEGGIRVPSIISWPNKIPRNELRDQVVIGSDWYATLMDLCKLDTPKNLDSRSLVPLLYNNSEKTPHTSLNWVLQKQSAIRSGKWKLLINPIDTTNQKRRRMKGVYLYDLSNDHSELVNLAKEYPEVVQKLQAEHMEWKKRSLKKP